MLSVLPLGGLDAHDRRVGVFLRQFGPALGRDLLPGQVLEQRKHPLEGRGHGAVGRIGGVLLGHPKEIGAARRGFNGFSKWRSRGGDSRTQMAG